MHIIRMSEKVQNVALTSIESSSLMTINEKTLAACDFSGLLSIILKGTTDQYWHEKIDKHRKLQVEKCFT